MHFIHKILCFEVFLHKIALFFKNLFFPDFRSIEPVSRLIEIAIKDFGLNLPASIGARSIKTNFRSIKPLFLSIENRSEGFLKTCFLHVFFSIQTFSKTFWLSLFYRSKSSQLLSFSLKIFQRFLSFKAGKTLLPLIFSFIFMFHAF